MKIYISVEDIKKQTNEGFFLNEIDLGTGKSAAEIIGLAVLDKVKRLQLHNEKTVGVFDE